MAGKVITTRCQLKTSKKFVVETGGDQISMVWESHLKSPLIFKTMQRLIEGTLLAFLLMCGIAVAILIALFLGNIFIYLILLI